MFSRARRDLTGTALMTMARDARYKLVEFIDHEDGQLFDLAEDPYEETTLVLRRACRDPTALERAISTWRASSSMQTATWAKDKR